MCKENITSSAKREWPLASSLHSSQPKSICRVSTVRSALELKRVFDELAAAEATGISAEDKRKLEEQAAEKGLQALFKVTGNSCVYVSHLLLTAYVCREPSSRLTPSSGKPATGY